VDCIDFYEQVVRLDGIGDVADEFVRVHMAEIHHSDVNLFEFDFDLTMMIFFMNADEQIYGRYGGRDAKGADSKQSLAGLKYAMKAAIDAHCEKQPRVAPKKKPIFIRELPAARAVRGCIHCHNVKEILHKELERTKKWNRDEVWSYPPPQNVGFELEVDRGNAVSRVINGSAADKLGLKLGDFIHEIGKHRVSSFADAQYALHKSPKTGAIKVRWRRGTQLMNGDLKLAEGWRRTDQSWRPSMQHLLASPRMFGMEISGAERKKLGLTATQLAFRHRDRILTQAKKAGIKAGDIVLGFDGDVLEMDSYDFQTYVRQTYLVGDSVKVNIIRDGKRIDLKMTFVD
jgi:membrane-associated protease RseP (regulator of RpoE activity)